jgi:hypothetical protein
VTALEGASIKITNTNIHGLFILSQEFEFQHLRLELLKFWLLSGALNRVRDGLFHEPFTFIGKASLIESNLTTAVALSPAVREQLSVDVCARHFHLNDDKLDIVNNLQSFLFGEMISINGSEPFVSRLLGNTNLELLFLGSSISEIRRTLLDFVIEKRIDFDSQELSVEALDVLLSSESISVDSEDSLLDFVLNLDSVYLGLLRHIQIEFLSEYGLSLLEKHFGSLPESVWNGVVERITQQTPPDSMIISDFPEIFADFRMKRFSLLWRGSRDGFGVSEFHNRWPATSLRSSAQISSPRCCADSST